MAYLNSFINNGKLHVNGNIDTSSCFVNETELSADLMSSSKVVKYLNLVNDSPMDSQIYTESDGSHWVRVFHHNNPASYLFQVTGNFTNGEYIDSNRWYFINNIASLLSSEWEFIIVQAGTSSATPSVFRWVQTANPETAVFADVASSAITKNTGTTSLISGVTSYTEAFSYYGGIYKYTGNTYLSANNGNPNTWWGAIGSWTRYNGGIPGYNEVMVTSGYLDIYIRVDSILSRYI